MMAKTRVVNVVVTADLGQELDLYELAKIKNVHYDPEIYGGRVAYFKSPTMKGKVSIFSSGKLISVGTKSEKRAIYELTQVSNCLLGKRMTGKTTKLQPKVQNIVAVADFERSVNLEGLSSDQKMIYEPEQFPGGILRVTEPCKATVLIFASGKVVIAGLRSSDQIKPIIGKLEKLLKASLRDQ
jgi:transcription initiation factor TFIID TATA-box-binding protein